MSKNPTVYGGRSPATEAISEYMNGETADPQTVILEVRALGTSRSQVRSLLAYVSRVDWKPERLKALLAALYEAGVVDNDELTDPIRR